jgi:hypothetical protein
VNVVARGVMLTASFKASTGSAGSFKPKGVASQDPSDVRGKGVAHKSTKVKLGPRVVLTAEEVRHMAGRTVSGVCSALLPGLRHPLL